MNSSEGHFKPKFVVKYLPKFGHGFQSGRLGEGANSLTELLRCLLLAWCPGRKNYSYDTSA